MKKRDGKRPVDQSVTAKLASNYIAQPRVIKSDQAIKGDQRRSRAARPVKIPSKSTQSPASFFQFSSKKQQKLCRFLQTQVPVSHPMKAL